MEFKKTLTLSFLTSLWTSLAFSSNCILDLSKAQNFTLQKLSSGRFTYIFENSNTFPKEEIDLIVNCFKDSPKEYINLISNLGLVEGIADNTTLVVGDWRNEQSEGVIQTDSGKIGMNGTKIETDCRVYASDGMNLLAYCRKGMNDSEFEFINLNGTRIASFHKNGDDYTLEIMSQSDICGSLPLVYAASKLANLRCSDEYYANSLNALQISGIVGGCVAGGFGLGALVYALYKQYTNTFIDDLYEYHGYGYGSIN